jgi:hypothetical protein
MLFYKFIMIYSGSKLNLNHFRKQIEKIILLLLKSFYSNFPSYMLYLSEVNLFVERLNQKRINLSSPNQA